MTTTPKTPRRLEGQTTAGLLAALTLTAIAALAAASSFVTLERSFTGQQRLSGSLGAARTALAVLTREIRQAGAGVPTASTPTKVSPVIEATPDRLVFLANLRGISAYLTSTATAGSDTLSLSSAEGLAVGDSIYITDGTRWEQHTVASVGPARLSLSAPLTYSFAAGSSVDPVEQVVLEYADGTLTRNGRPLLRWLDSFAFAYDSTTAASVHKIAFSLTVRSPEPDPTTKIAPTVQLAGAVTPPNLIR